MRYTVKKVGCPRKTRCTWPLVFIGIFIAIVATIGYLYRTTEVMAAEIAIETEAKVRLLDQNQTLTEDNHSWKEEFEFKVKNIFTDDVQNWQEFKVKAEALAPIYDYPVNVLLSQAALESMRGQSYQARVKNNYFGIGAYDSDPSQAFVYSSAEECIIEYMRLIKKHYPEAYALRKNPEAMIKAIKAGNYASDPLYVQKVMSMVEWNMK